MAVITLEPEANAATRVLEHRYGDAPRRPVQLAGVEMQRVEAQPHAVLAWVGPTFVVTFERGQQRTHAWLESLAEATLRAIAAGGGR